MRPMKIVGLVGFCSCLLFPAVAGAEKNITDHSESKPVHALEKTVTRVSDFVSDTVNSTVKTVDPVLTETVQTTTKTVEATVTYAEKTVNTITNPQETDAVVSTVVKDTKQLIEETVHDTGQTVATVTKESIGLVNETATDSTSLVRGTVSDVAKTVPDVPVVKPVVKETDDLVKNLTATVEKAMKNPGSATKELMSSSKQNVDSLIEPIADTVDTPTIDGTVSVEETTNHSEPTNGQNEASIQSSSLEEESSSIGSVQMSVDKTERNILEEKQIEPFIEENKSVLRKHSDRQKLGKEHYSKEKSPFQNENMFELNYPLLSLQPSGIGSIGKTSSSSPAFSGTDQLMAAIMLVGNRDKSENHFWRLDGDMMRTQWSNAPPEQPPCSTPFYFI